MTTDAKPIAPTADDIEQRFHSVPVKIARPVMIAGVGALRFARRFGWTAEGVETLRSLDGPLIFAANHMSHVDTAAILGTLPQPIRARTAVAAALDVFGPNDTGRTLKRECLQLIVAAGFHAFAFDRHGPPLRSIRTSVQLIRRGWNLLLYPEGTRSRTGSIDSFKSGVGLIARFSGRPVIPIHVAGGRTVQPNGQFLPGAGRLTVRYGGPIQFREGESPRAFAQRLRELVCDLRDRPAALPEGQTRGLETTG